MYDYKSGKKRIQEILNSKTEIVSVNDIPKQDSDFTYGNGIRAWVGAIFIDIIDSSSLFKNYKDEIVARIIRAFCSEIIEILRQNEKYVQIGIRGDCVFGIYSVPYKSDLVNVLNDSIMVNTFLNMLNMILEKNSCPTIKVGIGLGADNNLIVKAGKKGTGINDYVWIGDAVVDASKLSSEGNRNGFDAIVMNSCFYDNIKDADANTDDAFSNYFKNIYSYKLKEMVYHGSMVYSEFDEWIRNGMNG